METFIVVLTYAIIVLGYLFSLWISNLNYKNRNAEIPNVVKDIYDTEAYAKWHQYNMVNFKFGLITNAITTVLFILLLSLGYFPFVHGLSEDLSNNYGLQVVLFIGFYFLITFIVDIFVSYYQTFVIEEAFGFNKATKSTFFKDKVKSFVLTIILGGGLIYGLASLYANVSSMFFLYAYLGLIVIAFLTNLLYVKVFVPLFNKLKPMEDSPLKTKIEAFAKSVGYEISKISIIDASKRSSKLNAYFSGLGKFKQIVLYDTLIDKCSDEEIVAILAHEIGHNKHHHIWFGLIQMIIMLSFYVGLFVLLIEVNVFSTAFHFESTNFGFAIILFTVFIQPIMIPINMITSAISRKHEYQADAFAATHYNKVSMIASLKILARENFSNLTPHPLYVKIFYSHPPIAQRVQAILDIKD